MDNNKISAKKILKNINPRVFLGNYIEVNHSGWPKHTTVTPELILIIEGRFYAQFYNQPKYTLTPGDILLIPPDNPCDFLKINQKEKAIISCIHFELYQNKNLIKNEYSLNWSPPWIIKNNEDWHLIDLFKKCAAEFQSHLLYREILINTIFKEIWIRISRLRNENSRSTKQRTIEMQNYIRQNLTNNINRNNLAAEFALTPEYINMIFKKELGISPTKFINRERILHAAKLITSGRYSVSQAAYMSGFKDPLYFSRVFSKEIGIPPSKLK